MPITVSGKKSLRSSLQKKSLNLEWKKKWKESRRIFLKNKSKENLAKVAGVIDKMVKRKIFHKNKAAKLKSRLTKLSAKK